MIDKSVFVKEKSSFQYKQIKAEALLEKQKKKFEEALNKANIDPKLKELLLLQEEVIDNSEASKEIEKAINEYLRKKKVDKDQFVELKKLSTSLNRVKKVAEIKEDVQDVNEEFSVGKLFQKLKQGKGKSYISNKVKSSLNFGSMIKGAIHGAGVAFDIPALNILASEIKTETKSNIDTVKKLDDIIKSSGSGKFSATKTDVASEIKESNEISGDIVSLNQKQVEKLESIDRKFDVLDKTVKDVIFRQKDEANDRQKTSEKIIKEEKKKSPLLKPQDESGSFGLLDLIGAGAIGKGLKGKFGKQKLFGVVKGLGKTVGSIGGVALSAVSKLAIPLMVIKGAYDIFQGVDESKELFDLKNGKTTIGQKISAGIGSLISGLTFGFVDEKSMTKKVYAASDWISDSGLVKSARKFTTNPESMKVAEKLEQAGVVDLSMFGDSKIRDWNAIRKLPKSKIDALIKYDDWDQQTLQRLKEISKAKSDLRGQTTGQSKLLQRQMSLKSQIDQIPVNEKKSTDQRNVTGNQKIVQEKVIVKESVSKRVDDYSLESKDLVETMTLYGVRL